jgi:transposase, IS5 family
MSTYTLIGLVRTKNTRAPLKTYYISDKYINLRKQSKVRQKGETMGIYHPSATLFEGESRAELIDRLGDPLLALSKLINWEGFRPGLEEYFPTEKLARGGRPRMDPLMMLKILILQKLYDLSDQAMEFQIADRLSFQRFLGIESTKGIPDEKTIWLYREQIKEHGLIDQLFNEFLQRLRDKSMIINKGKIVDASLVHVPKQRNTKEENSKLDAGKTPETWKENPNKDRQKDKDATWVKKNGQSYYGYKDHIKIDSKSKLIEEYQVSVNSLHDSQALEDVLGNEDENQNLYADSAYRSQEIEEMLKGKGIKSKVHEKGYRGKPLTEKQKTRNTKKSRTRARVEHIFGHIKTKMGGLKIRSIGLDRASVNIGLFNLVYNIDRCLFILKRQGISLPI